MGVQILKRSMSKTCRFNQMTPRVSQRAPSAWYFLRMGARGVEQELSTPLNGIFDPAAAGLGAHALTYTMQGCNATTNMFVRQIFAGFDIVACPSQPPFLMAPGTPSGGDMVVSSANNSSSKGQSLITKLTVAVNSQRLSHTSRK